MGRAGVTLSEVEEAALKLQGHGKNPSIDAVREILGTGSKSTIAQHLRAWKSTQHEAQGKLPHELQALVTGLWERLHAHADQRVTDAEQTHAEQAQILRQTLLQSQQEVGQLNKRLHQNEEALAELRLKNESQETNFLALQQEHAKLNERHQATQQQLDDSKAENKRLHQLANNIQANLEHYQAAIQQQRSEQQLANEKQQTQFQQEIQRLQQELTYSRQQSEHHQSELQHKTLAFQQLKTQQDDLQKAQIELVQRHQQREYDFNKLTEHYQKSAKKIQTLETELHMKNKCVIDLEKEAAVLKEKINALDKNLRISENKVESLRQEKLFLAQEKAELLGALKQLEKRG